MSRCYPFPPPGYEPKTRTGIIDLPTKEKHVGKKHKKEKRDKEKRGHKERRDKKDRIKDKHKEKKDQKHKDRKKEKDRDKGRTSEDRKAEALSQIHNDLHIKESWQKTDEGKDSNFEEELGKRTKDDGAENPIVGSFANSIQRRNDRSDLPIENFAISLQKEADYICTEDTMEKERSKMHGRVVVRRDSVPSRNHGISSSTVRVSDLVIRKTGGSTAEMDKEKCGERSSVSNFVVPGPDRRKILCSKSLAPSSLATAQTRKHVLGMPVENLSSIHHQKPDKKSKTHFKKAEDSFDHSVQKSKAKDKEDRITKEKQKEENIVENAEAILHNKFRNNGKKDQADTLNCKPLAPHKDEAIGIECVDGTMKKRTNLDTNGYIKENDERPRKIPKLTSASQALVKSGAINNLRPDRLLENKERMINGPNKNKSDVSLVLLPHPDSKYLNQIYAVPKMAELPELDDQEWLFNFHDSLQKSKTELKAEKIPQVFAQAMRIDSADILALPYVVPF